MQHFQIGRIIITTTKLLGKEEQQQEQEEQEQKQMMMRMQTMTKEEQRRRSKKMNKKEGFFLCEVQSTLSLGRIIITATKLREEEKACSQREVERRERKEKGLSLSTLQLHVPGLTNFLRVMRLASRVLLGLFYDCFKYPCRTSRDKNQRKRKKERVR